MKQERKLTNEVNTKTDEWEKFLKSLGICKDSQIDFLYAHLLQLNVSSRMKLSDVLVLC